MILAKPAGQALQKAEMRSVEEITYRVDCKELLAENEIIVSVLPLGIEGLSYEGLRSRAGTTLEVKLKPQELGTSQYQDFVIDIPFTTNYGNKRLASFSLRVYR